MIRVVLAVALASALLGAALPTVERAERDRNAALAAGELERLADRAERLAADNDPVEAGNDPAAVTVAVAPPRPRFTDGGRLVVRDDRLAWWPERGRNETVETSVPIRVEAPIRLTSRTRLRLSFVRVGGEGVVRIERQRAGEG